MGTVEVDQHSGAVDSLPVKGIVRKYIGIVPRHLGGQEIFDPAALHNLGEGCAVAEGIRQPESIRCIIKIFPGKFLSPHELADHVLPGRDIAVAFHIYAAIGLIPPLCHSLFDILKEGRVHLFDNLTVVSRALYKGILRVLIHQVHLVGIGSGTFLLRLSPMPEPCRIHMRMPDETGVGCGGPVFHLENLFQDFVRPAHLHAENLRLLVLEIIGYQVVDLQHGADKGRPAVALLLQGLHHLVGHSQVKIKFRHLFVLQADLHGMIFNPVLFLRFYKEGLRPLDIMVGIILEGHLDGLALMGLLAEHIAVMIPMAVYNEFGGKVTVGPAVHPQHSLIAPDAGIDEKPLSVQFPGNGVFPLKPAVDALPLEYRAVLTGSKAGLLRHIVVPSVRLIRSHWHGSYNLEQFRLQPPLQPFQLGKRSL